MRHRRLSVLLVTLALVLALVPAAFAVGEPQRVIVELDAPPTAVAQAAADAAFDAAAHEAVLLAAQDDLLAAANTAGLEVEVVTDPVPARTTFVFNGFAALVSAGDVDQLAGLPGVKAVHPDAPVHALLDESVGHIRAPEVWENLGTRGKGQQIAVLDTGIHWQHPMFGGSPLPPGEGHPKIKRVMTFTAGTNDFYGHGTHVASTAAGSSGYATTTFGEARYQGVAPEADLWDYKVLSDAGSGSTFSIVLGIEDAAERGASVLNLSLGSENGNPKAPSSTAVNNATLAGSAVAVAAGNSGPGYSTIGSPASAHEAITVGASTDPGDDGFLARLDVTPPLADMPIIPLAGSPIPEVSQTEFYYDCGLALTPTDCAGAKDKIALIERGAVTFTQKAANAQAAGAIAAVIYNNVQGGFAGTLVVVEPDIPVVAMSQEDGHRLLEETYFDQVSRTSRSPLTLDWGQPVDITDQVAGFSSRGPNDDHVLKPDVVAPGNNITAAVPPVGQLASLDGYADAGGTSMAAPHVAGVLALLRSLHDDWTPGMAKTALMNTAVQLVDPDTGRLYSVHDQGAGRVDAYAAATTPALIGEMRSDDSLARGSLNLGKVTTNGKTQTVSRDLLLRDLSGSRDRWRLVFEPGDGTDRVDEKQRGRAWPAKGLDLRIERRVMHLDAEESSTVTVTVTVDGTLPPGDYEGRIVASNSSKDVLRVPVTVTVGQ